MRLLLPPSRTVRGSADDFGPLDRYTGTLYKALDVPGLTAAQRRYAERTLVIHDKELGLLAADRVGIEARIESPALNGLVIDARSNEYRKLIPPRPDWWLLRVVTEGDDGRRLAISHWNKHHKGVLAAALVRARPRVRGIEDLLAWGSASGIRLDVVGDRALDLVV